MSKVNLRCHWYVLCRQEHEPAAPAEIAVDAEARFLQSLPVAAFTSEDLQWTPFKLRREGMAREPNRFKSISSTCRGIDVTSLWRRESVEFDHRP